MSQITDEEELAIRRRVFSRRTLKRELGQDVLSLIFDREERKAENERLRETIESLKNFEGYGWEDLLKICRLLLDKQYPSDIFTGESGEKGPGFVRRIREALQALPDLTAAWGIVAEPFREEE